MHYIKYSLLIFTLFIWTACGGPEGEKAETTEAGEVSEAEDAEVYVISPKTSSINWEGSKPTGTHNGTIDIEEGELAVEDDRITAGSVVIDMSTIEVKDLTGEDKQNLENHLKGTVEGKEDHFFNIREYPTAKFEVTKITALEGDADYNTLVYGNLTIKDQTNQISFKANTNISGNTVRVNSEKFTIDRTKWGANYNSRKILGMDADNFIYDPIGLQFDIMATAEE